MREELSLAESEACGPIVDGSWKVVGNLLVPNCEKKVTKALVF